MACKCTQDFFTGDGELIADPSSYKGVMVGRNRVVCQECLDAAILMQKNRDIQEKKQALNQLELANLRKLYDGEDLKAINAQRLALRSDVAIKTSEVEALVSVKELKEKKA
jgi:hypothetical protein